MTGTDIINSAKPLLDIDIANTDYDADFLTYLKDAMSGLGSTRLMPVDESVSVTSDMRSFDLPTGIERIRDMELFKTNCSPVDLQDDYFTHDGVCWLEKSLNAYVGYTFRIWGLGYFTEPNALTDTLTGVPQDWKKLLVYDVVSSFYQALAGNRRKYSIYAGSGGQKANEDMKDSATYFKNLRDLEFEEKVPNV